MYGFHLPDPQKTASCGQSRETLESIAHGRSGMKLDNSLPPILRSFDQIPLYGTKMERSPSLSSVYTSSQSNYTSSRASTPAGLPSPHLNGSEPYLAAAYPTPNQAFPHGSRCSACLERGEHIPLALGQSCPECCTLDAEQHSQVKASRKKRKDRQKFSRMNKENKRVEKASKDKTEAGRRLDQTSRIGLLQRLLQCNNPSIAQEAHWKHLKPNNISRDSHFPLEYNKEHVYEASYQMIKDDNVIIEDSVRIYDAIMTEAQSLDRAGADPALLAAFVKRLANNNWAARVTESAAHRGASRFERPLVATQRCSSRL